MTDGEDNVTVLDTGFPGRAWGEHFFDQYTAVFAPQPIRNFQVPGQIVVKGLDNKTYPGLNDLAVLDQVGDDFFGPVNGNREPDPLSLGVDRRVDADQVPMDV